jgi:hypothetical protein
LPLKFPTIKHPGLWTACTVVLFVSIALEFYARACGFLVTSDSLQYLSAANSFSESGNFLSPDGSYYSYWPPLFPVLLSCFKHPESALVWINLVCKIVLVVVLLQIANSLIQDSILKIIFLAASLVGVHIIMISVFIWSELTFMTLIFLNAYCALHLKRYRSCFYWLMLTGFLACLQRNAGLFWITGVSVWLLFDTSLPWRIRILQNAGCVLVCTSGLWAWNIYNTFFIPADFSFYRHDFFSYAIPNLGSTLITFGKMVIPLNGIAGIITGILFFIVLFLAVVKGESDRAIQFLGIVLLFYSLGFLIMPGHLDFFEMDRYFSVITPIVYLFLMLMVQKKTRLAKATLRALIYVIVFAWLCYPVTRTFRNVRAWHDRSCRSNPVS